MTIDTGATKSGPYTANGSQTIFAYGFKVYASTDLEVIETSVAGVESIVTTSAYTVSGVGEDVGGNVTFTTAPASGKKITIRLNPPVEQQTNLRNQGSYLPEVVERALDRLCMLIQSAKEEIGRSVKIDISGASSTATYLADCQTAAENAATSAADAEIYADNAGDYASAAATSAAVTNPSAPQGRLSLSSVSSVSSSEITASPNVFYLPHVGRVVPINNGSAYVMRLIGFTGLQLTLNNPNHAADSNYDVFIFDNAGVLTLGTGPAWTSATVRNEDIYNDGGVLVNDSSITLRNGATTYTVGAFLATFLGTIRTSGTAITEDSFSKRFVSNAYNAVARPMRAVDGTNTWNYSTDAYRQANFNSANQLAFVQSLNNYPVTASAFGATQNSTTTQRNVSTGIGLDAANASVVRSITSVDSVYIQTSQAHYNNFTGIGYHYLSWLERGAGSDTQTWFGDGGGNNQTGIYGTVFA